jgi:hypothetical protein
LKISKKVIIYIAVGVYIIAAASIGMITFQRLDEESKVKEELAVAQGSLSRASPERVSSQRSELEDKLAQTTQQYEAVKALMSQQIGNVRASSIVFDIAKSSNVEITALSSPSAWIDTLQNVNCSVLSLTLAVEGDIRDLVRFITTLNSYIPTGFIKSIVMSIPEPGSEEESSADILLLIYTYQGD